jgi:hypothetical protein
VGGTNSSMNQQMKCRLVMMMADFFLQFPRSLLNQNLAGKYSQNEGFSASFLQLFGFVSLLL